jgi:hypothetical protein
MPTIAEGTWDVSVNGYEGELIFSIGGHGKVTGTIQLADLPVFKIEGWAGPVAGPDAIFFMRFDENDDPVQGFSGYVFRGPNAQTSTIGGTASFVGVGRPYTGIFGWFATAR